MRKPKPLIAVLALVAVLAVIAALFIGACGGQTTTTSTVPAPPVTTTATAPPSTTSTTSTATTSGRNPFQSGTVTQTQTVTQTTSTPTTPVRTGPKYTSCKGNVEVTSSASCAFGNNMFYWVWHARNDGKWNEQGPLKDLVWSPVTMQDYPTICQLQGNEVNCTNEEDTSADIRFSLASVQAYTKQEALAYWNSGKLGPGTAMSGENP